MSRSKSACFCLALGLLLSLSQIAEARPGSVSSYLLSKARAGQDLYVVIEIEMVARPEGDLADEAAVGLQRRAIAHAQDSVIADCNGTDHSVLRRLASIPFLAMRVGADALAALDRSDNVKRVIEDEPLRPVLTESVPMVEAEQAHATGMDGTGWSVAVIDTGVERTHAFLSGKVVSEACFSLKGNCPGGVTQLTGTGSGAPCTFASTDCTHGTHVAGIVAGKASVTTQNNRISGVAKGASIIAVQVMSNVSGYASAYATDIIAGLEHVLSLKSERNIAAVNISLGGKSYASPSECSTNDPGYGAIFANLRSVGIPVVVASGNNNYSDKIALPACVSSAVSVGNTTKSDAVFTGQGGSNAASFGPTLLAPGTNILSSIPGGSGLLTRYTGTSMAAPHVAGAWAILKQRTPSASLQQIQDALVATGFPITDARNGQQYSRIRVMQALKQISEAGNEPRFSITLTQGSYGVGNTIIASEFRLRNPNPSPVTAHIRVWLKIPTIGEVNLIEIGADGSFALPPNIDANLAPLSLIYITPEFPPRGQWEMNSRIRNPQTGNVVSEDINPFTIQ